jgi:CRP-like cAMP-binding protein
LIDYAEVTLLASSAFFAVLSIGLLYRYRQVSRSIGESTDMGRDLWSALEQRLKRQDERILDMMARFEVVQARVMNFQLATPPPPSAFLSPSPNDRVAEQTNLATQTAPVDVIASIVPEATSHTESQRQIPTSRLELDETQVSAISLLAQKDMNTREITDALQRSREHTARIMKALFESGLVTRDASKKPFVYKLTEAGRARLS